MKFPSKADLQELINTFNIVIYMDSYTLVA